MQKGHGEILIITTIDQLDKAEALARGLIEKKLAACVTRLPGARSSYRWESDEIKDETEVLLFIKSLCTNDDKAVQVLMLEVKWTLIRLMTQSGKYYGGTLAIVPTTYGRRYKNVKRYFAKTIQR